MNWSLVIATYDRESILAQCLTAAVGQTRPPAEVIVVDASPDWEKARDRVVPALRAAGRHIRWKYVKADRRSSAAQRNQGVRLATEEILFLIDDDSLLYDDCAERLLRIYEADREHAVAGVAAASVPVPPGAAAPARVEQPYSPLAKVVRRVLGADDLFVPYDAEFPRHVIPESLHGMAVAQLSVMGGFAMTFRRHVCLEEPFEELLMDYSAGEDSDMSYRASRHGILLTAQDARLYHMQATGGRLNPFVFAALGNITPAVLHRIHSGDMQRSLNRTRKLLWRRLLIAVAKDLATRTWSLPSARGTFLAVRYLDSVFSRSESELRSWYARFQREMVES